MLEIEEVHKVLELFLVRVEKVLIVKVVMVVMVMLELKVGILQMMGHSQ